MVVTVSLRAGWFGWLYSVLFSIWPAGYLPGRSYWLKLRLRGVGIGSDTLAGGWEDGGIAFPATTKPNSTYTRRHESWIRHGASKRQCLNFSELLLYSRDTYSSSKVTGSGRRSVWMVGASWNAGQVPKVSSSPPHNAPSSGCLDPII